MTKIWLSLVVMIMWFSLNLCSIKIANDYLCLEDGGFLLFMTFYFQFQISKSIIEILLVNYFGLLAGPISNRRNSLLHIQIMYRSLHSQPNQESKI